MTEGREMTQKESRDSGRFEAVLRVLLNAGYRPPEARPEFKNDLLARMKAKQAEVAAAHRRRRRIRTLVFSTVTAAAASVMLLLAVPFASQPSSVQPEPSSASKAAQEVTADSASSRWSGTVAGLVEVRDGEGGWNASSGTLSAASPISLRTTDQQAGIDLAQGVRLVLEKGAQLDLASNAISVDHGLLRVQVRDGAEPLTLSLGGHRMRLEAGSDVEVAVQNPSRFAPGGQPAPDVMVIAGNASVLGEGPKAQPAALLAGRRYQLHHYQAYDRIGGERLDDRIMDDQSRWLQPQLVRFLTTDR